MGTFCPHCGENLGTDGTINSHATPNIEIISLKEKPEKEQTTISMHQKMGWTLKSSQEINTSTTEVSNDANGNITSFLIPTIFAFYGFLIFENAMDDWFVEYDFLTVTLYGAFFLICFALALSIVCPIAWAISGKKITKETLPKIAEIYRNMEVVAELSERYLQIQK